MSFIAGCRVLGASPGTQATSGGRDGFYQGKLHRWMGRFIYIYTHIFYFYLFFIFLIYLFIFVFFIFYSPYSQAAFWMFFFPRVPGVFEPSRQVTVRSAWTMSAKDHPDVPNRNREAIKTFSAEEAKNRHIHVTCWRKTNDYESTIEQAVFPFEEALQWNTADDLAAAFPEPKMEPVDPFHLVLHNVSMEDFRMKVTVRSSGRKAQFEMEGRGNRVPW